jgi:hypothetical protein
MHGRLIDKTRVDGGCRWVWQSINGQRLRPAVSRIGITPKHHIRISDIKPHGKMIWQAFTKFLGLTVLGTVVDVLFLARDHVLTNTNIIRLPARPQKLSRNAYGLITLLEYFCAFSLL